MAFSINRKKRDDRRFKVGFVESASAMGGVQFSTLYLAQRLSRDLWKPIVLSPEEGDLTRACRDADVETHVIDQKGLRSTSVRVGNSLRLPNPAAWIWNGFVSGAALRKLTRFLVQSPPDLLVTKGLSAHFVGGMAARRLGIPCVWHIQDFISERWFGIYRHAFGRAGRWLPQQIIVDGATIAAQLPRALQSRVTVIHNGVDTSIFRPGLNNDAVRRELNIPVDHLVVGHMGRITPWKGQHYLIEAFAEIASRQPKVTLLLVGAPVFDNDSYQQRLLNMATHLGLEERVKFAGYRHDTARVLAAMDVFAFTSVEKDTSPLALLSAMSCGLPIVAFDIAGVRELMRSEDQFRLVPVKDVAALCEALTTVLSDRALRKQLGASARERATADFDLDKYTARSEQVFLEALQSDQVSTAKHAVSEVQTAAAELRDCA